MSIEFIRAGLQTSIQDLGRKGQMHNGISHSGAMDPVSMQLANYLVGNAAGDAVLEITLVGPQIRFQQAMTIAITGALFELKLNQQILSPYQSYRIKPGDTLEFGKLKQGCRAYLACSAPFDLPSVFDSLSTHTIAGFGGKVFADGDRLQCQNSRLAAAKMLPSQYRLNYSGHYLLRYTPGIEAEQFTTQHQQQLQQQDWQISAQSNRMGMRLSGDVLTHLPHKQMLSSGLLPGAIQIPTSGLPIISCMDGQTVGGYPRLGQIIQADLSLLGQVKGGDQIRLCPVGTKDAWQLKHQQQQLIRQLF